MYEKPMKEILYRESRVARALGDPSKFTIINVLFKHGPVSVLEITRRVKRSKSTVSHHLSALRSLEIARYEVKRDGVYYWIKYPEELRSVLGALRTFVERAQKGLASDV
jgi:DNA-binding transcriptional ArsR family regulator